MPMFRNPKRVLRYTLAMQCGLIAPAAHAMDLSRAVDLALGHDAGLAQAQAGYEAAQQARPQARAALLPQIAGGWGRTWNRIDTSGFPRTDYWQNGWTVSLSQPIFDWSKWTAWQQSDLVAARGAVELDSARQTTILHAAEVYFDALAAEDELTRAQDYLAAVESFAQDSRRKHAGGEATVIDLRDADSAQQQAQLQWLDAQQALLAKRRALEQTTGQPFETCARLPDRLPLPALDPADAEAWAAQARDAAYTVQRSRLDQQIAKLDAKKIHAEHYPVIAATATYTPAGAAAGYSRPTTTTTAMLTVTIPLYSGGETVARERAALALADKAEAGATAAMRDSEGAARDDYARYQLDRTRADALTRLIDAAHATLDATRIGYRVGSRSGTDVLRALETLYAARRDLARSRYDAVLALLQLKALTASLTLGDIAQISNGMSVPETKPETKMDVAPASRGAPAPAVMTAVVTSVVPPVANPVATHASTMQATIPAGAPSPALRTRPDTTEQAAAPSSWHSTPFAPSAPPVQPVQPVPPALTALPASSPASTRSRPNTDNGSIGSAFAPWLPNANTAATGLLDLRPLDPDALHPL